MFLLYLCIIHTDAMFQTLTFFHSIFRWLVLVSLIWAITSAYIGYKNKRSYTKNNNLVRHGTATIAHIQLLIGILLYSQSPITRYFWANKGGGAQVFEISFFAVIHALIMLIAIIVVTVGSALAKRKQEDSEKFKTVLLWFSIALLLILIAIPWPFSPFASRPYVR